MKVKYTVMLFGEIETGDWNDPGYPPATEKEILDDLMQAANRLRDPSGQLLDNITSVEVQWENPDQWYSYPGPTKEDITDYKAYHAGEGVHTP